MTAPTGPDRTGVVERLDALEAAWKAATPGPWKVGLRAGTGTGYYTDDGCPLGSAGLRADAAAIVAEHNAFPELLAAVRGVLDLADELDLRADAKGFHPMPGYYRAGLSDGEGYAADRLRSTVAAALGEA